MDATTNGYLKNYVVIDGNGKVVFTDIETLEIVGEPIGSLKNIGENGIENILKIVSEKELGIMQNLDSACEFKEMCKAYMKDELLAELRSELVKKERLKKALINNEVRIVYQPQYKLTTHELVGAEALARWEDKELGIFGPGDFIPIAEKHGFINLLGRYVLIRACKQNKEWQDKGYKKIRVSVNISYSHFEKGDILKDIEDALTESGLEPKWLEIELTESKAPSNIHEQVKILRKISEMGISISIDDFGTGYSTLNYIRNFPIDGIKIDKSFMTADEDDRMLKHIVNLSREMGLYTVAEGVETIEQLDNAVRYGCDIVQGYLFGKPMGSKEMELLMKI